MGFWIMSLFFFVGLGLLIYSIKNRRENNIYYLPMIVGVLMIIVAVILASPDGSQKIFEFIQ